MGETVWKLTLDSTEVLSTMSFGGGFHSNSQSTFNTPQTGGGFGMGSTFGSSQGPGGFGQTSTSAFFNSTPASPNSGGSVFGGNTTSQLFGSFGQQNRGFGSSSAVAPFGGSGSTFAMQTGPTGIAPDGSQGTQGRAFERTPETSDSGSSGAKAYLMTIVAMKDFVDCQPEMLRAADYKKGHRRSSGQVQAMGSASVGVFGGGGFGGNTTPSGGSSPFGGGGFRGSTGFGVGGSAGIFGQSTPQPSGGITPSFGQSASSFGQPASSGGFGPSFGMSSSSIFGGSSAFGQQSNPSVFGSQQQPKPSIFGNQPTATFGSSAFAQRASSGGGLFGQPSSTSVFSSSAPAPFGGGTFGSSGGLFAQSSSAGLFGVQSSGGFGCKAASSGSLFGSFSSGTSIFGQQSSGGFFGRPGQSTSFASSSSLFQIPSQSQPLFGPQQPQVPGGVASGPMPSSQQQPFGQRLGYFVTNAPKSASDVQPSGLPDWNNMSSSMAQILQQNLSAAQSKPGNMLSEWPLSGKRNLRYIPVQVHFPEEETESTKGTQSKFQMDWTSFSLARPMHTSLADEIQSAIEEYGRNVPHSSSQDAACEVTQLPASGSQVFPEASAPPEDNTSQSRASRLNLLPVLENSEYYIRPSMNELEQLIQQKGEDALKAVPNVEIGRSDFGEVTFLSPVNLQKLDINATLRIERGKVEPGPKSNCLKGIPVAVTLFKVFSRDKGMRGFLEGERDLKLEIERLRKYTTKFNGEFVSYDRHGTWKFKVETLK